MSAIDFIKALPQDLIGEITSHLDIKNLGSASVVSKTWFTHFTNSEMWQRRLFTEYGIKTSWDKNSPLNKKLYQTFQNRWIQRSHLKFLYVNPARHELFEAIIENDVDKAKRLLPLEESQFWFEWATHAGAINICKMIISNTKEGGILEKYFEASALSGNITLVQYFLDKKYWLDQSILLAAMHSGNVNLFELIKNTRVCALAKVDILREAAAKSGNPQLFEAVERHISHKRPQPSRREYWEGDAKKCYLAAIESGNAALLEQLFKIFPMPNIRATELYIKALNRGHRKIAQRLKDKYPQMEQIPTDDIFISLIKGENLNWIKDFLASDEGKLINLISCSDTIFRTGNLPLVKFILDPANGFNIQPQDQSLTNAILSGNLLLVKWLLAPEQKFNLDVTEYTKECAAQSDNLGMMMFFLDPENGLTSQLSGIAKHHLNNTNYFVLARLYKCHEDFLTSLDLVINGDSQAAVMNRLNNAYEAMPYHFYRMTRHVLLNPADKYQLIHDKDISKFEKFLHAIFETMQLEIVHPDLPASKWEDLFVEVANQFKDQHSALTERLFAESRRFQASGFSQSVGDQSSLHREDIRNLFAK